MTSVEEIKYFQKLIHDDFIMQPIKPVPNLFESVDPEIIGEIDKLTGTNSLQFRKNYVKKEKVRKNKKTRYNIPNATIKRHNHIG